MLDVVETTTGKKSVIGLVDLAGVLSEFGWSEVTVGMHLEDYLVEAKLEQ